MVICDFIAASAETDAEIAMPELHYNGVCNNIVVNIYAPEGVFPEGTNVKGENEK